MKHFIFFQLEKTVKFRKAKMVFDILLLWGFFVLLTSALDLSAAPQIAVVKSVCGEATLNHKQIKANDTIKANDVVFVGANAKVTLEFADGTVKIFRNQTLTLTSKNSRLYRKIQRNAENMTILGVKG